MTQNRTLVGFLLAAMLLGALPALSVAAPIPWRPAQDGSNLLRNPGFEGITCRPSSPPGECWDNWTRDTFNGSTYSEIYTPQEWVTFWSEGSNPTDEGKKYGRPECKVIANWGPWEGPPPRVNSGHYAVMQFGFWRAIDSGLYQTVTDLSSGAMVQLSAYAHSWSCEDESNGAYSCGDEHNMRFQVGIDPNGGTDPWSSSIVWASGYSQDEYRMIGPVQAQVGEGGTVTVFLRATAKWPYKHNDVYWDDAALVYTTPPASPTNTPLPPPPTSTPGPSPTPRPTPTPRPDGATVHIVESGDTLYGIALMYGVDADQIRELNADSLGPNDLIVVGQELVISIPSKTPTPLPAPATPTSTAVPGNPTPGSSAPESQKPDAGGTSICVLAFHDRNGNTFREDDAEELLPNAEFVVADASGVVGRYTSDGVSEPYCFAGLAAGAYRVIQNAPSGYQVSGPAEWNVALPEGMSWDLQFGNARGENPVPNEESAEPAPASGDEDQPAGSSTVRRIFATVAKISGVMVLILAVGVAVLFVLNRRRM